ncbi:hypothetical protein KIN20_003590 [Parelaphostrongylus tenuis]|uniref:Uncharacterized protein n=1 Tax=Parelaphostrongylus tenuis TaxID=148309 RepID=A0AAD5MQ45_PARTN|nr:hypothetical protein KIN20_003590 [Parelaphostrongylus tenuis]
MAIRTQELGIVRKTSAERKTVQHVTIHLTGTVACSSSASLGMGHVIAMIWAKPSKRAYAAEMQYQSSQKARGKKTGKTYHVLPFLYKMLVVAVKLFMLWYVCTFSGSMSDFIISIIE